MDARQGKDPSTARGFSLMRKPVGAYAVHGFRVLQRIGYCLLYQYCSTVCNMFFRLNAASGQPLYLQLMEQVRHAVETGTLKDGDQMPGIRTLAEELVVSHNTVAKAYTELQHAGLLELRHGSGAYICAPKREKARTTEYCRLPQGSQCGGVSPRGWVRHGCDPALI